MLFLLEYWDHSVLNWTVMRMVLYEVGNFRILYARLFLYYLIKKFLSHESWLVTTGKKWKINKIIYLLYDTHVFCVSFVWLGSILISLLLLRWCACSKNHFIYYFSGAVDQWIDCTNYVAYLSFKAVDMIYIVNRRFNELQLFGIGRDILGPYQRMSKWF